MCKHAFQTVAAQCPTDTIHCADSGKTWQSVMVDLRRWKCDAIVTAAYWRFNVAALKSARRSGIDRNRSNASISKNSRGFHCPQMRRIPRPIVGLTGIHRQGTGIWVSWGAVVDGVCPPSPWKATTCADEFQMTFRRDRSGCGGRSGQSDGNVRPGGEWDLPLGRVGISSQRGVIQGVFQSFSRRVGSGR
jgi:hypothetical protein